VPLKLPRLKLPRIKLPRIRLPRVKLPAPVAKAARPMVRVLKRTARLTAPFRRRLVKRIVPRWLKRRPKPAPIMKPYIDRNTFRRKVAKFIFPIALGFFCLLYGFFFGLTAPYLIVPFAFPVAILMMLAIWALPDQPHAPTKSMEFFFAGMIVSLIIWPNYLALALPGLPWITVLRLTTFPMTFFLLISLSTSEGFRRELKESMVSIPGLRLALLTFVVMQFVTIAFSKSIPNSISKALLQQVNWTGVLLAAAWVCRKPGRAERFVALFVMLALPVILVTFLESRQQKLLWTDHVPSFLKIDDPAAAAAMTGTTRSATGQYRAKATFSGPLGLGEYLALMTPFCIHYALGAYRPIIRICAAALVPLIFLCFILADSRLGIVGFLVSILLYGLLWGLMKMRQQRSSLLAAAIVYVYPAIFVAALGAVMFVGKVHKLVFGSGAQAASTAARQNQLHMAIPKFLENPIGHGPSQSGLAMGYSADSFITVDNYYITLALDYGAIGLSAFLATFGLAIMFGVRSAMRPPALRDRELSLLVPLAIALSAFLVIKAVFSQQDSHALAFAMIGMIAALVYRVASLQKEEEAQASAAAEPTPLSQRRPRIRVRENWSGTPLEAGRRNR